MDSGRRGDADIVSCGHRFLESPRWHRGVLYASDFYARQVLRWHQDGSTEVICEVPGEPSGLGWAATGELLVVSMTDRRLLRLDPGGELIEVADLWQYAPWHLNDMVVDRDGRAYIGNFGWDDETDERIASTVLLRVDPGGAVSVAADDLVNPNGIAISANGRTLLVSETFAARITAFDRATDGELTNRRVWASFSERSFETIPEALASGALLPDGIALDSSGALWVGDCAGTGAARVAPGGRVLERVSTGGHTAFAVALGGPLNRTLFLCTAPPFRRVDHRRTREACMCSHLASTAGLGDSGAARV